MNSVIKKIIMGVIMIGLVISFSISSIADTSGPRNGATFSDDTSYGVAVWSNPSNAQTSNDGYATASLTIGRGAQNPTHYLKAQNFGFTLGASDTIDGIKVEVEAKTSVVSAGTYDEAKLVLADGSIGTTDKATGQVLQTTDTYQTFGGVTDTWGETLTGADVNDVDFGFVVATAVVDTIATHSIDHIRITVYYTPAPSDTCTYSSGNWNVLCSDNCTVTSTVNLGGNDLQVDGYGRFTVASNGKIINAQEVNVVGTSSTNICEVTIYGGIN